MENVRRKHNYLPMIMEILKLLAKRGQLVQLCEEVVTYIAYNRQLDIHIINYCEVFTKILLRGCPRLSILSINVIIGTQEARVSFLLFTRSHIKHSKYFRHINFVVVGKENER